MNQVFDVKVHKSLNWNIFTI